jgi:DNA-binding beta-propeller fold protein YncE
MILDIKFTLATFVRSLRLCREGQRVGSRFAMVLVTVLVGLVGLSTAAPTRSTTIALTSDETRLVVVNREANTVSIIQVKDANGNDVANKLAEIAVGQEPRCVAIHPSDRAAYVTNGITGTV